MILATEIISIDGTVCPPAMEAEFQQWYDRWHIPQSMKFRGLTRVTRYRFAAFGGDATVTEYPQYLAIRRFRDLDALKAWNESQEQEVASRHFDELKAGGAELSWRVNYQHIKSWKNTSTTNLISMTGIHCKLEGEAAMDRWYTEEHIPDLLEFEDILGVTRYRLAEAQTAATGMMGPVNAADYPRFLTIYDYPDLRTAEAFDISPARNAARPAWLEARRQTGAIRVWRARYTPIGTWPG